MSDDDYGAAPQRRGCACSCVRTYYYYACWAAGAVGARAFTDTRRGAKGSLSWRVLALGLQEGGPLIHTTRAECKRRLPRITVLYCSKRERGRARPDVWIGTFTLRTPTPGPVRSHHPTRQSSSRGVVTWDAVRRAHMAHVMGSDEEIRPTLQSCTAP